MCKKNDHVFFSQLATIFFFFENGTIKNKICWICNGNIVCICNSTIIVWIWQWLDYYEKICGCFVLLIHWLGGISICRC
jgi:hypothetical protein